MHIELFIHWKTFIESLAVCQTPFKISKTINKTDIVPDLINISFRSIKFIGIQRKEVNTISNKIFG